MMRRNNIHVARFALPRATSGRYRIEKLVAGGATMNKFLKFCLLPAALLIGAATVTSAFAETTLERIQRTCPPSTPMRQNWFN
jgi:hypothetical protein